MPIMIIFIVIIAALCNVFAQISMKRAAQSALFKAGFTLKTVQAIVANPFVWLGLFLYLASFILGIKIYEKFALSIISPIMMALIFVVLLVLTNLIYNESHSMQKIIGIFIILMGIVIVARS